MEFSYKGDITHKRIEIRRRIVITFASYFFGSIEKKEREKKKISSGLRWKNPEQELRG